LLVLVVQREEILVLGGGLARLGVCLGQVERGDMHSGTARKLHQAALI
jgi:hypothetical protein